jgi:hypothetical protein
MSKGKEAQNEFKLPLKANHKRSEKRAERNIKKKLRYDQRMK